MPRTPRTSDHRQYVSPLGRKCRQLRDPGHPSLCQQHSGRPPQSPRSATLRLCHKCHQDVGVASFTSYSRLHFEPNHLFVLVHASTDAQEAATAITYLQSRYSWRLLQRLMR